MHPVAVHLSAKSMVKWSCTPAEAKHPGFAMGALGSAWGLMRRLNFRIYHANRWLHDDTPAFFLP